MKGTSTARLVGAKRVRDVTAYGPPRPTQPIDLRLDANEGMRPPAELLDFLAAAGPELIRRYPRAALLEQRLAERFALPRERVLATAGIDDALYRLCQATLEPGREFVLPEPTFEMLPRYAALAGGTVVSVPWWREEYPLASVLERIGPQTALIAVVSPNNPTGATATTGQIAQLARAVPSALVVLDLAYAEFADEDPTAAALSLPNVLVLRTFSKAWGLAGMRVGYALGPPEVIGWLRASGNPFAVSAPAAAVAAEWLQSGQSAVTAYARAVREERAALTDLLRRHGAQPLPSQGNFVLAEYPDAAAVWAALAQRGIAVRAFADPAPLGRCLRITCPGDAADFARLCDTLREILPADAGHHEGEST